MILKNIANGGHRQHATVITLILGSVQLIVSNNYYKLSVPGAVYPEACPQSLLFDCSTSRKGKVE